MQALWNCHTYRLLMIFTVLNGFVQYGLNQWWPSLYARVFGLSLSSVGVSLGIAIGVGSGVGLLIGGLMANQAAQRDVRLPLIIGAGGVTFALPTAFGSLFVSSPVVSTVLVGLTTMFWSISNGPVVANMYSVTMPRMRATAGAISVFFASVLGFGLGPFSVGLASDLLTPSFGTEAIRYALLVPASMLLFMVIALYAAAMKLPGDLRAAGVPVDFKPRTTPSLKAAVTE